MTQLLAGVVRSTGGTDFDCLFRHALDRGYRKILVVTDGHADLSEALQDEARRRDLRVFVVFTDARPRHPLKQVAEDSWELPASGQVTQFMGFGSSGGSDPRARLARGDRIPQRRR